MFLSAYLLEGGQKVNLDIMPKLKAIVDSVANDPCVAKWLKQRPQGLLWNYLLSPIRCFYCCNHINLNNVDNIYKHHFTFSNQNLNIVISIQTIKTYHTYRSFKKNHIFIHFNFFFRIELSLRSGRKGRCERHVLCHIRWEDMEYIVSKRYRLLLFLVLKKNFNNN